MTKFDLRATERKVWRARAERAPPEPPEDLRGPVSTYERRAQHVKGEHRADPCLPTPGLDVTGTASLSSRKRHFVHRC